MYFSILFFLQKLSTDSPVAMNTSHRRSSSSPSNKSQSSERRSPASLPLHKLVDRSSSMSACPAKSLSVVQDVYDAITAWIPRRKATIAKMEKIADEIKQTGGKLNKVKLASSCIGVLSSTTTGILGFETIVAQRGIPIPLVLLGKVTGLAGAIGATVSCSVDIIKADMLSRLLVEELQDKWGFEVDEYRTVINALAGLQKVITEKNRLSCHQPKSLACSIGQATFKIALNFLTIYSFMKVYIAEIASTGAAQVASASSWDCVQAAREATARSVVEAIIKGFSKNTVKAIMEAAGEGVTTTTATFVPAKAAAAIAAREAARTGIHKPAVTDYGSVDAGMAAIIDNYLPFLNLGSAALDAYEGFKASRDIAYGMHEEKLLRKKIEELKVEANKIVGEIYNPIGSHEMLNLPLIEIPFPKYRL